MKDKPLTQTAHSAVIRTLLACLAILLLSTGCGGAREGDTTELDPTSVILTRLPTLNAQMSQSAPTLQAQLTQNAPTMQAIMTLMATASTPIGVEPVASAGLTPTPAAPSGGTPGGSEPSEGGTPVYTGIDGYETAQQNPIAVGQTVSGSLPTATQSHNWVFQGTAGQTVTIRVTGSGGADPRAQLIDPSGNVLLVDDDGGGRPNALITATLSVAGMYTIRVDAWSPGSYTVSLE